ncbi:MAG: lipopolysaccharide heptosyltransferase II [Verrucomicrobiota bacterium]
MKGGSQKILVRGVNWLGDAVMTTPALQRLREAKPGAEIVLLTHEKLADLWRDQPVVDSIRTFSSGESAWSIGKKLRAEKFDVGLAFPNSHRSAIELWLAGIPHRIGYAHSLRNFFLTQPVPPHPVLVKMRKRSGAEIKRLVAGLNPVAPMAIPAQAHHIHQYLHLVGTLGANTEPLAPHLEISQREVANFQRRVAEISGNENPFWLGLNPGAEYGPAKRWLPERFVEAALQIHQQTGCGWIIFGGKDSATQIVAAELEKKLDQKNVANFAGKTTLRELCAGLKYCRLVLTNDTGPMHIAAALGTPIVVPFGSTSPELTGPTPSKRNVVLQSNVPCSPCFLRECPIDFRCMKSIETSEVVRSCLSLLKIM